MMLEVKPGRPGGAKRVYGLSGCAEAIALARLARHRRVLALADDPAAALRLSDQLRGLMESSQVHHVVGWEVLPYDATSPPKAIASERVAAMARLRAGARGVFVTAASDAMLPCVPPKILGGSAFQLAVGDALDARKLSASLSAAGCANVDRVRAAGEFAVYGGQMDIYPGGQLRPLRLVMEDERIEQIRTFDPATQLSTGRKERVDVLPSREYPLDEDSILAFRKRWRERFDGDVADEVYRVVSQGVEADGAEFYLPLFYGERASIFDYLVRNDVIWHHEGLRDRLENFSRLIQERHENSLSYEIAALTPEELFLSPDALMDKVARSSAVVVCQEGTQDAEDAGAMALPPLGVRRDSARPYSLLSKWLENRRGRVVFTCSGHARKDRVLEALRSSGAKAAETDTVVGRRHGVFLFEGSLTGGFDCPASSLAVVTEAELHDYVPSPRLERSAAVAASELDDLSPGELVVHLEHGIARYHGLTTIETDGVADEFVHLEFANGVKLFVAVAQCHLVSRHRQPERGEKIELHALGSRRWKRMRSKAEQTARDTAAHLLELYALREATGARDKRPLDETAYATFCAGFEHAETADQLRASAEVVADLCGARPMDRLVCGEVGYGKTEIAMRAAWVSWSHGNQVAIIAPTTVLSDQHHRTFTERFEGTGARLLELSTLHSQAHRKKTLAELGTGAPSIVVGTHALLSQGVTIPKLGLVVIDEEHRFGVRQKERMREMRANVDVLAMSATPIPRTLSLALEGLRDMSLVATPPPDRLEVRTFVSEDWDSVVREALSRELARGGQVFYVHHRVQTISVAEERIRDLAPDAVIGVAHGQMPHPRLEAVMHGFYRGEIDVLLCTSIVESGIDVANANTMIVPRADHFGLAQLHQLRGRVGRSARQGYAYFLVPSAIKNSRKGGSKADDRLQTIAESTHRGGGHYIARRDLEIRGAGEVLGEAQSGVIIGIGMEAFKRMLSTATRSARTGRRVADCEVDFGGHARLPAGYCDSAVERMRCYRTLSGMEDAEEVESFREQLADRFGSLPAQARLLVDSHLLRIKANGLGVVSIKASSRGLKMSFGESPSFVDEILAMVDRRDDCRLEPDNGIRIIAGGDMHDQLRRATQVCEELERSVLAA